MVVLSVGEFYLIEFNVFFYLAVPGDEDLATGLADKRVEIRKAEIARNTSFHRLKRILYGPLTKGRVL